MKVAIYARYSTDKQDRSSIDGQIKNCREKAKELGFAVSKVFKDEAMSGTDLERPGFLALREALDCGDVDGVILDETSRLARNSYTLNQMVEHLGFHNQFIIDCKGYDSRSELAELSTAVTSALDSMKRRRIAARTYRGVRERAEKGCSCLVLCNCENLALSPAWWKGRSPEQKSAVSACLSRGTNIFAPTDPDYLTQGLEGLGGWRIGSVYTNPG